jgi:hypothetical protein
VVGSSNPVEGYSNQWRELCSSAIVLSNYTEDHV